MRRPAVSPVGTAMGVAAAILPVVAVRGRAEMSTRTAVLVMDRGRSVCIASQIGESPECNCQRLPRRISFAMAAAAGVAGTRRQQAESETHDDRARQDEWFPHLPSPYRFWMPTPPPWSPPSAPMPREGRIPTTGWCLGPWVTSISVLFQGAPREARIGLLAKRYIQYYMQI